jgi:acyl-coenzyme A thioesterase PaaI-like protein
MAVAHVVAVQRGIPCDEEHASNSTGAASPPAPGFVVRGRAAYAPPTMDTPASPTPELEPARHASRRLADALRSLVADIVDHDLSEDQALALLAGVEDLAAEAGGPHRPRYYETAALEQARAAFVDFSPISGRSHPLGIPMETEWVPGPDGGLGVRARLRIGMTHEGPPHGVHGGVIAAVFDELLGHAQQAHQVRALTATLTVRYRAVTPVDEDLVMFAQVVHASGRRWAGKATCAAGDTVTAEAEALFVGVDLGAIAAR